MRPFPFPSYFCSSCSAPTSQCGPGKATEKGLPAVDLLLLAEGANENDTEWDADRWDNYAATVEPEVFAASSAALGHAQEVHGHRFR